MKSREPVSAPHRCPGWWNRQRPFLYLVVVASNSGMACRWTNLRHESNIVTQRARYINRSIGWPWTMPTLARPAADMATATTPRQKTPWYRESYIPSKPARPSCFIPS
ncbi:hypothetical protein BR93DRAFT_33391 [Coniochaeta sp. PMI_546]|nr:hypothetical protein BR93DRAFT_33391 [Coniochaeta sp. PMI_546]